MEDITDADYAHTKRVCKDFQLKDLEEYHEMFVQSDIKELHELHNDLSYLSEWMNIGQKACR